ncbi:hypothetical protein F5Y19DRAFT_429809 [Xylariaceae sp. FL1651]|nr:hypothetical protein F5Y19DRAFT_429809 [Xylariaceae sp. FL1651]
MVPFPPDPWKMATSTTHTPQVRDRALVEALARVLPKDSHFTAWHLSTTPNITDALYYPPALRFATDKRPSKPLKTYCEKHFLAVSIADPNTSKDVLVLGLELYIYTTAFSTTIFVAKADSTGYLHLQSAPKGFSPIQAVIIAFVDFLVEHRRRPSKQLVINLFARAQSQYLFPGSIKNDKKHILDDRGLIKWWCRVLNPLLEEHDVNKSTRNWGRRHGYLIIPGLDDYETRAFIPRTEQALCNWTLGDPLELTSPYTKDTTTFSDRIPPRCLIPTYPDDPKARFVEELEESTSEKAKLESGWKAPSTLDQFWEMMAYRQECSSGRMTGFVWVVFEPPTASATSGRQQSNAIDSMLTPTTSLSGAKSQVDLPLTLKDQDGIARLVTPTSSPSKSKLAGTKLPQRKRRVKKVLKGPIVPREPRVKTQNRTKYPSQIETPYYYWPEAGRGQVVFNDNDYKRAVELLLHLEFKSLGQAIASTSRWINEVNTGEDWGLHVIGEKVIRGQSASSALGAVNNLSGSIVKKRPGDGDPSKENAPTPVNMLGSGLVRKRVKVDEDRIPTDTQSADGVVSEAKVNVLGAGLVRKKAKAS